MSENMPAQFPAFDESTEQRPTRWEMFYRDNERMMLVLAVFLCATVPYFFINQFNQGRQAAYLMTSIDRVIPFQKGWEYVYMTFQLMCFLPFTIVRDIQLLRRMAQAYWMVYGIAYASFVIFPVEMVRVPVSEVNSFLDWGVRVNLAIDAPFNCFPSLHVAIAFTSAWTVWMASRRIGAIAFLHAAAIAVSTLTLKQHYIADVLAALVLTSAASYWFLVPYQRNARSAFPTRFAFIIPVLYAVGIGITYLMYLAGVPAPPETKWERAAATRTAPVPFGKVAAAAE
jgi:membrane-associated phospholipid phosphatase